MRRSIKTAKSTLLGICLLSALSLPILASTSDALINFTAGTGPTKPVDPDNPGTEEPGPDPGVTGQLAIVKVTALDFGDMPISANRATYDIVADERPNIQVVDLRGDTSGWKLDASITRFQDKQGNDVLPGAFITFIGGELNSLVNMQYAPTVKTGVVLDPPDPEGQGGATVNIMEAPADSGKGTGLWVNRWYAQNTANDPLVTLTIPAGANNVKGEYAAEITWILTSAE